MNIRKADFLKFIITCIMFSVFHNDTYKKNFTCNAIENVKHVQSSFLGGLSLHLNHLIAERVSAPYWQFGTLPIGIFLSNLDSRQLETSLMTSYCHF